jgi:hypothetical protein
MSMVKSVCRSPPGDTIQLKGEVNIQSYLGRILSIAVVLALLFPTDAFAYLDPGTGSMVVQSVIAVLAAAGYAIRLYWSRIQSLFRRSRESEQARPSIERT